MPTQATGLGHRRRRPAIEADAVRAPRPSPRRCRDPHQPRRHLPLRPPHLPQRLGRDALSGHPGPRDRRHRDRRRRRRHRAQGRRHRRGRLHGRQLHEVRPVPRRLGNLLPRRLRPDLQQPRSPRQDDQQGRLHRPYRRPRPFRLQGAAGHGRRPRRAVAVRRDHDLLAAAPVQRRRRHQGRGRRAWRARPHGGQARRGDGRARHDDHHHAREGRGRAQARRARRHRLDRHGAR